ncbi:MGH1-like glycoside hydrolase domain-containing protein [Parabacteroides timonensis]|uniref:MGH1-like glycoside hydrolase domain-containing protein n=1 Tax=Parabacteroides timonensis TaxID=1871013 RepID=UPI00094E3781|nr:glycosyl hydrolase family 65 protein [Parabacteroides timonensis]
MNKYIITFLLLFCSSGLSFKVIGQILDHKTLDSYVDRFNQQDEELYVQYIPNNQAKKFLSENIPLFECPDKNIEEIYYFRWWTFRKHLKKTPDGFIVTEFLPDVSWAGKYNGICCPAWFHFREGRWLKNNKFLKDYAYYWIKGGGALRSYSFPVTDAIYQYSLVTGDNQILKDLYSELKENYIEWKKEKFIPETGLFWQTDNRDGMEISIGGNGFRATINSYMAAEAAILSRIAEWKNDPQAKTLKEEAEKLKNNLFKKLWDQDAEFLKVLPQETNARLQNVRELHGYTPWAFDLADPEYAVAWKYLMDTRYFLAPYGPTTAEQCHPEFKVVYEGHECQWNGPSWPYSTSMTLTGLSNLLNNQVQPFIFSSDYVTLLTIYARSQYRRKDNGTQIPWIDENLNPFTGDWISRTILKHRNRLPEERGRDYNHSSFCDLIINGLVGIRPQEGNRLDINPLVPEGHWDYFCLDNVSYHGRTICVLYDKTGEKYNKGAGLSIFIDGQKVASSPTLKRISCEL